MTDLQQIISDLEQQKTAIESALAALRGLSADTPQRRGPGRPSGKRGSGTPPKKRSNISEEGRQRIAEALRKRWAAKKAAAKKAAGKTAVRKTTPSSSRSVRKKTAGKRPAGRKKAGAKTPPPSPQTQS